MKDLVNGKIFIFSGKKSEKVTGLLESKVEGMSLLGFNTIIPIKKFKKNSFIPFLSIKVAFGAVMFSIYSYSIGIVKWIKQLFKKTNKKVSLKDIIIDLVQVKEEKFTSEESEGNLDYMCLCAYIKTKKTLIGVILYGYRIEKNQK